MKNMMKYFECVIRDVKVNGLEVKNALIVNGIQDGPSQPDLTFLIPEAYRGADIMGKRYIHEEQRFEQVDVEPTPLPDPMSAVATKKDMLDIMDGQADIYIALLGGMM